MLTNYERITTMNKTCLICDKESSVHPINGYPMPYCDVHAKKILNIDFVYTLALKEATI